MTKVIKFPTALVSGDYSSSSLVLEGGSVIDQCIVTAGERGTFFLQQHLLYVVLGGRVTLSCGNQTFVVNKNEMILLKKSQSVSYIKEGNNGKGLFESMLFALQDNLIKDFLTLQNVQIPPMKEEYTAKVSQMSDTLIAYCKSLSPYFDNPSQINEGLLRLKVMELLYNVMDCSKNIFRQILQLRNPVKTDIHRIVEQNYTSPVSLEDLAYLSGRSLSSFKRDFQQIYNTTPAKYIREKRLQKAKELLQSTAMPVSEVAYSLGFENPTHFTHIFKDYFGTAPSTIAEV
ncbi:MAG: helix-turn-helix domain-containing protein [Bacteroidales bacterium]|nr:helix-turn-helix domain-containing protein [Bacteroidales bacterium]